MQEDAVRRVREMQQRSRAITGGYVPFPERQMVPTQSPHQPPPPGPQGAGTSRPYVSESHPSGEHTRGHSGGSRHSMPPTGNRPSSSTQGGATLPALTQVSDSLSSLFSLELDQDRVILLMLFFVLWKEEADTSLLMALGYLFLG